jgi:hypothetical protein
VIDAENGKVLFRQSLSDDLPAAPANPATATAYRYFPNAASSGRCAQRRLHRERLAPATATKLSGNAADPVIVSHAARVPPVVWNSRIRPGRHQLS